MDFDIKRYTPFIIGAGALAVAWYLFRNNTPSTSYGSQVIPAPDNSSSVAAASAAYAQQTNTAVQGFSAILGYENQRLTDATNIQAANIAAQVNHDNNVAAQAINANNNNTNVALTNSNNKAAVRSSAISALAGIAAYAFIAACYYDTKITRENRVFMDIPATVEQPNLASPRIAYLM